MFAGILPHDADFYPRSPCGERPSISMPKPGKVRISIHALLAESDVSFMLYDTSSLIFLSTLSLRRATMLTAFLSGQLLDFYPRSPCGERLISDAPSSAP